MSDTRRRVVYVTQVYRFCAGHRLFRSDWSDQQNWDVFGPCSYADGHGHNYTLEVTVRGSPNPDTGWVVPPSLLDRHVDDKVMAHVDHRNLNERLQLEHGPTPTTEVLVLELWEALEASLQEPARLYRIKVSETSKNSFEYFGR